MADANIAAESVSIYGLIDPISGFLRYVGKTKVTLRQRLNGHLSDVRRGRVYIPRHRWIASLLAVGAEPTIVSLDTCHKTEWQEAEQFWIAYLRSIGCPLLNATAGGDGIEDHRHSPETKEKQRSAALRRYLSAEAKKQTGDAVRLAHQREDAKANLKAAAAKRDHPRPEALISYSRSAEGRRRTSERSLGKTLSAESREKISKANRGRKMPEGFSERQSAYRKGTRLSEETKAKIGLANAKHAEATAERMKARWQDPEYLAMQKAIDRAGKMKASWADPEFRARRVEANRLAANRRRKSG